MGDLGVAETSLTPSGTVEIEGHVFSARAKGPSIDKGQSIIVVAGDIGGLVVQSADNHVEIPNLGDVVYGSFGDRAKALAKQEEDERLATLAAWQRKAKWHRAILGTLFGFTSGWLLCWPIDNETMLKSLGWFVVGFLWAVFVFRVLDHIIRRFDEGYIRLVTPAACVALIGSAIGLSTASSLGTTMGLFLAAGGGLVGGIVVPAIGCLLLAE